MKERPILFSGAMVCALLDGRKTQTRRIVKLPHNNPLGQWEPITFGGENGGRTASGETVPLQGGIWHTRTGDCLMSPHGQPGDRLWVRETAKCGFRSEQPPQNKGCIGVDYQAGGGLMRDYAIDRQEDFPWFPSRSHNVDGTTRWAPAIHMPRWASRITLEVTGVRVERLQEISTEDCIAEGMSSTLREHDACVNLRDDYRQLWDSLNAERGYGWDINPWVWAVEFKRIETSGGGNAVAL